jgi:choline kinase
LNGVTGDLPKCLVNIGGMTLLERQVQSLKLCGIDDIRVVVGHGADSVRETCGAGVGYVENLCYHKTNSLFSLWMAREHMSDGFVVMNGDVLFHPQLLRNLLSFWHEDALLISRCDGNEPPLGDEEMKVKVRHGTIADITKEMDPKKADGENVGIAKFGPAGARVLVEKMDELIAAGSHRDWAPRAFREFAFERPLSAVSTGGFPWIEIDYPEDYARALDQILPLILMDEEMAKEQQLVVAAMSSDV